jgi:hypothetical protein
LRFRLLLRTFRFEKLVLENLMVKRSSLLAQNILSADGPDEPLSDYSLEVSTLAKCKVIFRNHQTKLLEFIDRHDTLLGAVAWFTDRKLIGALSNKRVGIIVQKEDFLRPDSKSSKKALKTAYASVPDRLTRYEIPGRANYMSYAGSPEVQPFRCVGNFNRNSSPAMPRMHNKFLIGCDFEDNGEDAYGWVKPRAVWTGSYNFTYNAQDSFENAVVLYDNEVAEAFANEWSQIFAISESLDWESDWVFPEYRIGS